jgi:hypothetical protein
MYFAGIHAGIQSYHAGIEYALKFWDYAEFQQWARNDKTVIVLNGLDSNTLCVDHYSGENYYAAMQSTTLNLSFHKVPFAEFYEPGANNTLSSIGFLVDETVWDKKLYPDPVIVSDDPEEYEDMFTKELIRMYGEKTAFLRQYLKQFKLAS